MSVPNGRPTFRTLDEIAAETERIVNESAMGLQLMSRRIAHDERDRLTAHALVRTRRRTIEALRRYRAAGASNADRTYRQYASVFELVDPFNTLRDAESLEEAERQMAEGDEALSDALVATTGGDPTAADAASALVVMIDQMKRECAHVISTARTL
jgi:hypothetical protein